MRVLDTDVGAVGFERDAIVAIVDSPVLKKYVVAEYSVCAVGVCFYCTLA